MELLGAPFPDLVALGEAMAELNEVAPGQYQQGFGGDTSNLVIAAARQGARTGYISALGDDVFGHKLRALWQQEGVDARAVQRVADAPTGLYLVTHSAQGHAFSFYRSGSAASRMRPADLAPGTLAHSWITRAKMLHVSGISAAISPNACDTVYEAAALVKAGGGKLAFDTNLRLKLWPKERAGAIVLDLLSRADIALPGYDDLAALTGLDDAQAMLALCLERGAKLVALKLGAQGTLLATPAGERVHIPPHPCQPVDATGAGDCFGGTFLARLLAGDTPPQAARYAAVAAALSTEGYGAIPPLPHAAQVWAALSHAPIPESA